MILWRLHSSWIWTGDRYRPIEASSYVSGIETTKTLGPWNVNAGAGTRVKLRFGIPIFATSLIDRVSRKFRRTSGGVEAARGDYKDKPGTRKNLKRLKDYKSGP